MTFSTEDPFFGPVPQTVPLPQTPLTSVLVQVRFPEVLSIAKAEFIADFQERIRAEYPLHLKDQNPILEVIGDGIRPNLTSNWRFLDEERKWRLSLTTNFVTLETRAYQSRSDFVQRTRKVVQALSETIKPSLVTRIGVRYVDRLLDAQLDQLSHFVRPEMLGLCIGNCRKNLGRVISEAVGETDVGTMTARWGAMPEKHTHEPDLMPPISAPSWFLDVDVYNEFEQSEAFNAQEIEARVTKLAERAYGFFRWAVSDEFLKACGGNP